MDIFTLAAARAYTDKKVAEGGGGGGGGGLPVVEVTTAPTMDGAVLTAEEAAQVENAMNSKTAIIVVTAESFMPISVVCSLLSSGDERAFVGHFVSINGATGSLILFQLMVAAMDGQGIAMIEQVGG